jgi:hypothetical protein
MRTRYIGILTFLALAGTASIASAENAKEVAKERFEKGVSLFKQGDYDAALVEFKAAYKAEPHYAVRYNIGICLFKLHRYLKAYLELEAYLQEGGDEVPDGKRAEVGIILDELEALTGTLKINCNVEDADLYIDGFSAASWIARLDVGEHTVEIEAPGYKPYKKIIEVPGGQATVVEVNLVPKSLDVTGKEEEVGKGEQKKEPTDEKDGEDGDEKTKLPMAPFIGMAGLTGALAIVASITGGLVISKDRRFSKLTPEEDGYESIQKSGRSLALATDILWGLAGASAIATIVLAIFTDFSRKEARSSKAAISFQAQGLAIYLGGSF